MPKNKDTIELCQQLSQVLSDTSERGGRRLLNHEIPNDLHSLHLYYIHHYRSRLESFYSSLLTSDTPGQF